MKNQTVQAYNLVIFGAKGDLAFRKLIPALYELEKCKYLHKNTKIIGVGRAKWDNKKYIEIILEALQKYTNQNISINLWNKFKERLSFCNLDVCKIKKFVKLENMLSQKINTNIYYLAVPPNTFEYICTGLGKIQLNKIPNRIIVEKPIGISLKSSKITNDTLGRYFLEKQIFRIDHYLGKETILNLLSFRFSNPLFYYIWNKEMIEYVQITIAEEVGIEGRWGYFDKIGQMRDMVQNHLLQILSIIAMSPPKNLESYNIQYEKIKVLRALRKIDIGNVQQTTIRGQYTQGIIHNKIVPSYIKEYGANKNSNTETFVAIKANIDNDRWQGVPFYLKTGKRLFNKTSEIIIAFKKIPGLLFKNNEYDNISNILKIRLQPNEGIEINFYNKIPNLHSEYTLENKKLNFNYNQTDKTKKIPDAYERLLLESMRNNQSLFVSREEIEEAWNWIDSIIDAWSYYNIPPELYKSGSWGPKSSERILKNKKHNWNHI